MQRGDVKKRSKGEYEREDLKGRHSGNRARLNSLISEDA